MHTLVGLYDSPFVRRVAITMRAYGIAYEHKSLSVFRNADQFRAYNPTLKAPTLVLPDGGVLVESTAIIDYLDELAPAGVRLTPATGPDRRRVLNICAIACVTAEKAVALVVETRLRPEEKWHAPLQDRAREQMRAGLGWLESLLPPEGSPAGKFSQAELTAGVVFAFIGKAWPEDVAALSLPRLAALSARCEAMPEFVATRPS
jgi:glutathione S-transferase